MRQGITKHIAAAGLAMAILAGGAVTSATAQQQQQQRRPVGDLFSRMDLNKDGLISRDEAKQRAILNFAALDTDRNRVLDIEEFAAERPNASVDSVAQAFIELDQNSDDILTVFEYSRRASNLYVEMDTDNNGFLSRAEMDRWKKGLAELMRKRAEQRQRQQQQQR